MARISFKKLEEKVRFINNMSDNNVSVHKTAGAGVFLVINGNISSNMQNKKAYEELDKISKPIQEKWLIENGYK